MVRRFFMPNNKNRLTQVLFWFLPTWTELAIYIFLAIITIAISNMSFIREFLYASNDFNPIRDAINSIDVVLQRIVGERVAGSLSLGIFWGLVGLLVNAFWWVGSNFSTELNNDLVFSNYVHPQNYDPKTPLREFISKSVFRFGIVVVLLFYVNYTIRELLPHLTSHYSNIVSSWGQSMNFIGLIVGALLQVIALHAFVVLFRLLLLKKQLFAR